MSLPKTTKSKINMSLQSIAQTSLDVLSTGLYTNSFGIVIDISADLNYSIDNSVLYTPESKQELNKSINLTRRIFPKPTITVTQETVLQCSRRLCDKNVCVLNFASGKNPGGGFLSGTQAQEESIARSSGLYKSLLKHEEYYKENRKADGFYLDYAIYSPNVPVFKDDYGDYLDKPYCMSVVTSPAPKKSQVMSEYSDTKYIEDNIRDVLDRRMKQVLSIMVKHGHREIVLGAWGCGVFGNDPVMVADLFRKNLTSMPFFDKITFPIFEKDTSPIFEAFVNTFYNSI